MAVGLFGTHNVMTRAVPKPKELCSEGDRENGTGKSNSSGTRSGS